MLFFPNLYTKNCFKNIRLYEQYMEYLRCSKSQDPIKSALLDKMIHQKRWSKLHNHDVHDVHYIWYFKSQQDHSRNWYFMALGFNRNLVQRFLTSPEMQIKKHESFRVWILPRKKFVKYSFFPFMCSLNFTSTSSRNVNNQNLYVSVNHNSLSIPHQQFRGRHPTTIRKQISISSSSPSINWAIIKISLAYLIIPLNEQKTEHKFQLVHILGLLLNL